MKKISKRRLSSSITLKFTLIIFLSNFALIISLFFLLRSEFAKKDQNIAEIRFHEVSEVFKDNNTDLLSKMEEKQFNQYEDLLIVVVDPEKNIVFKKLPSDIKNFRLSAIEDAIQAAFAKTGNSTIYPILWFEETIEIFSKPSGSHHLIVGVSTDSSEDFLHLYFKWALIGTLVSGMVSTALGYYSSKKALLPIRDLIATVKLAKSGNLHTIENLSDSGDELSELTNLFNEMILQIQKLISSLQSSLDSISHDLRTPLTHMTNRLELLLKSQEAYITKENIGDLLEETQNITSLVHTLLEITEADSKGLVLKKEVFPISTLIQECVDLYEYVSEEKGTKIQVTCHEDILVFADRNKTKRVLANLIDNSIKFGSADPIISIRCTRNKSLCLLTIEDNGIGIPKNDLSKIWQRLYRGDSSRSTAGMGLGLSFVKSIADAHGWSIQVDSELGRGTKIDISMAIGETEKRSAGADTNPSTLPPQ